MNANVTPMPTPPAPVEKKTRTITLTNRAPIQIVEDEWPVIAQGTIGWDHPGSDVEGWSVDMRVRKGPYRYLIHATYRYIVEDNPDACEHVRVGRIVDEYTPLTATALWENIREVADELQARIIHENMKVQATLAVDQCFANLKPMPY